MSIALPSETRYCQDVGFPYMLEDHHPADTLFLFFESDFRLNEEHCLEPDVWLPLVLQERVGGEPAASSRSRATGNKGEPDASLLELIPYGEPDASLTDGDIEEEIFGHVTQGTEPEKYRNAVQGSRPQREIVGVVSQVLQDIVATVTQARRNDCGEIVWFGWNASKKSTARQKAPGGGSQFISFTRFGAQHCLQSMVDSAPDHFDGWLLDLLNDRPSDDKWSFPGACYVCPPVGGFSIHESIICGQGDPCVERVNHWGESWTLAGGPAEQTRWNKSRALCRFRSKGHPQEIAKLNLPMKDSSLFWRTKKPPEDPASEDRVWQLILRERKWVDEHTNKWWGPWKGYWRKDESGAWRPPPKEWEELVQRPHHWEQRGTYGSQISRLAEHIVTSYPDEPVAETWSLRHKRERRHAVNQYKKRFFVQPGELVGW